MYRSEAAFGHAFDNAMISMGWDVHNIQTPTTEVGCPDRFLQNIVGVWVELKNIQSAVNSHEVFIPYRPGQQAWLKKHYDHGGLGFTAIAGLDGILVFRNMAILSNKVYSQGRWPQLNMSHLYSKTLSDWLIQFGGKI